MSEAKTPKDPIPKSRSTAAEVLEGKDLTGKTYVITGANSGIGFQAARALALHGGSVIMGCRNLEAAKTAREKIIAEKDSADVQIERLDLGDLKSVEECAAKLSARQGKIDCLLLNAGVYNPEPRVTSLGLEATFQVNHLAHFYFAELMKDKMMASAPSRIVVVATVGHKGWSIGKTPISQFTKEYFAKTDPPHSGLMSYALSKLANVLHAKGLQKRYGAQGVTACSLHPGVIKTNIDKNSYLWKAIFGFFALPWRITEEQGAATSVYCATVDDLAEFGAGEYFADCRIDNCAEAAKDEARVDAMWNLSEQLIKDYKVGGDGGEK